MAEKRTRTFVVCTTEDFLEKEEKVIPVCPECGSNNVRPYGTLSWICYDCKRQFFKKYRKRIYPPRTQKCPDCGSNDLLNWGGQYWKCKCGKSFRKEGR